MITTIFLLFFFQLITEFVEAVYLFGLLGSDIPPEIGMVLLFLSPLILFLFRNRISPRWIKVLISIALLTRAIEIILPTRGRMIVSGLGVAAFLMAFPATLSQIRLAASQRRFAQLIGYALPLALLTAVVSRALCSGSDIFAFGMFKLLTWGLTLIALVLLWHHKSFVKENARSRKPHIGRVIAYAFGITSILITLYFALTAPNVVARWAGVSHFSIYFVLILSWLIVGWWWLRRETLSVKWIFAWGLGFALLLLFAILPHQVDFPPMVNGGYPLLAPQIVSWQYVPLYLMLILSPVLLLLMVRYLDGILAEQPTLNSLAGAFGLCGGYILVMVLAQVFTTVYDYIPVIGPFFRDKFWLVMFVPALGAALPALLPLQDSQHKPDFSSALRLTWSLTALGFSLIALLGFNLLKADPDSRIEPGETVRVFTYNIRQGYNLAGERNFDGQINLIRSKAPDILGLQECDTARIAGGNADVVAYFADRLNMYSYYGPSPVTGTFGVALLSRYPIENARTFYLYSLGEQVAVIEAEITIADQKYQVFVTHLGNRGPIFQQEQLLELMRGHENVITMGDFNFRHYQKQYEITVAEFDDAYIQAGEKNIPTNFDLEERIDHVFISQGMPVKYVEYLTQPESDHPALYIEIEP